MIDSTRINDYVTAIMWGGAQSLIFWCPKGTKAEMDLRSKREIGKQFIIDQAWKLASMIKPKRKH